MKIAYLPIFSEMPHPAVVQSIKYGKQQADKLICGILTDDILTEQGFTPSIPFQQRKELFESIRYVDEVIAQNSRGPRKNLLYIKEQHPQANILLLHNSNSPEILGSATIQQLGGEIKKVEGIESFSLINAARQFKKKNLDKNQTPGLSKKKFIQGWGGLTSLQSLECHTLRYVQFPNHFANAIKGRIYMEITKGHHTVYFDEQDVQQWNEEGKALLDKKVRKKILDLNILQLKKFYSFLKQTNNMGYQHLSNQELFDIYSYLMYLIMENGAFFAYSREETTKAIKQEILKHLTPYDNAQEIFEALTTPTMEDIFSRELEHKIALLEKSTLTQQDFENYIEKHSWRFINLYSKEEIIQYLKEELSQELLEDLEYKQQKRKEKIKTLTKQQQRYLKMIGSRTVTQLSSFLRLAAVLRLENKRVWAGYEILFLDLFNEIARRMNLNVKDMLFSHRIEDIQTFLQHETPLDKEEINKRLNYFNYTITPRNTLINYSPLYTPEQLSLKTTGDHLTGESGNLGKVIGKVKIVTEDSLAALAKLKQEISEEDIYITTMTHPAMVSLLHHVKGVVTDEGGITSHAAIISRELGLPCLVGTRNATTFFKEGEYIELDSYQKTVRRLNKQELQDYQAKKNFQQTEKTYTSSTHITLQRRNIDKTSPYFVQQGLGNAYGNVLGGKGSNLEECSTLYQVPPYIVLTRRYFDELLNNYLGTKTSLTLNLSLEENLQQQLQDFTTFITNQPLPPKLLQELQTLTSQLPTETFAVRSSASCEDSNNVSFAGQFTTLLGIPAEQVAKALQECLASSLTHNVVVYAGNMGISFDDFYMSVVIQSFIKSEKAGVCFSRSPNNPTKKGVWIDANFGVGESVVSGIVKPDHYWIENGHITKHISENKKAFNYHNGKKQETYIGKQQVLNEQEIRQLTNLCYLLLDEYQQDIEFEWCIANNQLYLLQIRPITV